MYCDIVDDDTVMDRQMRIEAHRAKLQEQHDRAAAIHAAKQAEVSTYWLCNTRRDKPKWALTALIPEIVGLHGWGIIMTIFYQQLAEKKRQERLEDWDRHQSGQGYRSKVKVTTRHGDSHANCAAP